MLRFLRFLTVLFIACFASVPAFAASTCDKTYTSCTGDYYLDLSSGQCLTCSSGYHVNSSHTGCDPDCSTSKSCSSDFSGFSGTYNECTQNQSSACSKSCTKTCSGNDTSSCPANATCSYNTSYYTTGTQYYGGTCSASSSLCPVSSFTCNSGYRKNAAGTGCELDCSTSKSCPSGYSGTYNECTQNQSSACYKSCSSYTSGGYTYTPTNSNAYYPNDCSYNSSCTTPCTSVANTTQTQSGNEGCSVTGGTGTRSYTNKCNGYYTSSGCSSAGASCSGCSSWSRTSTGSCSVTSCNAGYEKSGSSCKPCSDYNYTDSKTETQTVDISHGTKNQERTCTRPVTYSSVSGDSCTASYGDWSCGSWSDVSIATCDAGYYASSMACVEVGDGYYSGNGSTNRTQCTQTSGWSVHTTTTTASDYTTCYQTQTPGNCASGTVKRTAKSLSGTTITYNTTQEVSSALTAKPNYYVNDTTCSLCSGLAGGLYNKSAGTTGGSEQCYASVPDGKYLSKVNDTSFTSCNPGTHKATHTVYYDNTSSCDPCQNWTYSGSGAKTCSACPTVESGYEKKDSVSTGWTTYTDCVEIAKASPSNCASGRLAKKAYSNTKWGAAYVDTDSPLASNPNYYVNGTSCSSCSTGTSSQYKLSDGGSISVDYCYTNKTVTGQQNNCQCPNNSTCTCDTCSPGSCQYKDFYKATDSPCTPTNCDQSVKTFTCNSGYYKDGNVCKPQSNIPGGYTCPGDSDISGCYRNCTASDITGASSVSGNFYYNESKDSNSCTLTSCSSGYYKDGNLCKTQPSGYTCPDGNTGIAQCYRTCTASDITGASNVSGNFYYNESKDNNSCTLTSCAAGYYKDGNVCKPQSDIPGGYTCPGGSDISGCYRNCTASDITGASSVSGNFYYNESKDNNSCVAESCVAGYYKDANVCKPQSNIPGDYTCPGETDIYGCYEEIETNCYNPGPNTECLSESEHALQKCFYDTEVDVTCNRYYGQESCSTVPKCPYKENTCESKFVFIVEHQACERCANLYDANDLDKILIPGVVGDDWPDSFGGVGANSCMTLKGCVFPCPDPVDGVNCPQNAVCKRVSDSINGTLYYPYKDPNDFEHCTVTSSCSYTWNDCIDGYDRVKVSKYSRDYMCTEGVRQVVLNDNGGASGSGTIYEKYTQGWYSDSDASTQISNINIPTRTNWTFLGYFDQQTGGNNVFDYDPDDHIGDTTFALPNKYDLFTQNTTLYAQWKQNVIQCESGKYYDGATFKDCESGRYCPGTEYIHSDSAIPKGYTLIGAEGCYVSCPVDDLNGVISSQTGSTEISQCKTVRSDVAVPNGYGSGDQTCGYNSSKEEYSANCTIKITKCEAGHWRNGDDATICSDTQPGEYSEKDEVEKHLCSALTGHNGTTTSLINSGTAEDCYNICTDRDEIIDNGVRNPNNAKVNYNGTTFPACSYTTSCTTGYKVTNDLLACEPKVIPLAVDPNHDSVPSYTIYLKYNTGWYSDDAATQSITSLDKPDYLAHTFGGYYYNTTINIADNTGKLTTNYTVLDGSESAPIAHANWSDNPKISCDPGEYYSGSGDTCTPCPEGSYCPGVTEVPQDTAEVGKNSCTGLNGTHETIEPFVSSISSPAQSESAAACYATNIKLTGTNGYGYYNKCFYNSAANKYDQNCSDDGFEIIYCNAGHYWASSEDMDCSPVGIGYYSNASSVDRVQCPNTENGATTRSDTSGQIENCYLGEIWYKNDHSGQRRSCYHTADESDTDITAYQYNCESGQIVTCDAGYYDDGSTTNVRGERDCAPVGENYYSPSQSYFTSEPEQPLSTYSGMASSRSRYACPDNGITGTTTTTALPTECYVVCEAYSTDNMESFTFANRVGNDNKAYYDTTEDKYTCKYNVVCNDGYAVQNNGTAAPTCMETNCPAGQYWTGNYIGKSKECTVCAKGTAGSGKDKGSCVACENGYYADETGLTECKACPVGDPLGVIYSDIDRTSLTQCYETIANQTKLGNDDMNGTGTTKCYYADGKGYTSYCSVDFDTCDGGYYLAKDTDTSCSQVGIGFYSENGALARNACPLDTEGKQVTTSAQNSNTAELCYKNCEQLNYAHGYRKVAQGKENVFYSFDAGKYPTCEYTTYCDNGYTSINNDPYCTEGVFQITLNPDGGNGGTESVWVKYSIDWYATQEATNSITKVTIPTKANKTFVGFYTDAGVQVIDENGNILANKESLFIADNEVIAKWRTTPITCESGKYYDGENADIMQNCPSGYWCPGDTFVGIIDGNTALGYTPSGAVGCRNECPTDAAGGNVFSAQNTSAETGCQTNRTVAIDHGTGHEICTYNGNQYTDCETFVDTCDAGYYYNEAQNTCSIAPKGAYSSDEELVLHYCKDLSGANADTVTTSGQGSQSATDCYNVCPETDAMFTNPVTSESYKVGTYSPIVAEPHFATAKIPECQYLQPNCDNGYENIGDNVCTPKVLKITLDHNGGEQQSASQPLSDAVYLRYGVAWYDSQNLTNRIATVNIPKIAGKTFGGYLLDSATIVEADGTLPSSTTTFTSNATLKAIFTQNNPIRCEAGYYYKGTGTECTACEDGAWCPGANTFVDIEKETGRNVCTTDGYTAATSNLGISMSVEIHSGGTRGAATDCFATNVAYSTQNGAGSQICYYNNGKYTDRCESIVLLRCDAGYYNKEGNTCSITDKGAYSEQNALGQTACSTLPGADSTVTTSGQGAASATECYNTCPNEDVTFDNPTTEASVIVGYRTPLVQKPAYSSGTNNIPNCEYNIATCTDQCFENPTDSAVCTPKVSQITLNHDGGVAQSGAKPLSDTIYLQCSVGWFDSSTLASQIYVVNTPKKPGKSFEKYVDDSWAEIVKQDGALTDNYAIFTSDASIKAQYSDKPIVICPAGKYYNGYGDEDTGCITCPAGSWCPGLTENDNIRQDIEQEYGKNACPNGVNTYIAATDADESTMNVIVSSGVGTEDISGCYAQNVEYTATYGDGYQTCYYGKDGTYTANCVNKNLLRCVAGYYKSNTTDTECTIVDENSYSAEDELIKHQCPETEYKPGEFTVGTITADVREKITQCSVTGIISDIAHGKVQRDCQYNTTDNAYTNNCIEEKTRVVYCDAGYWDDGVKRNPRECVAVTGLAYSPESDTTTTDCPVGTTGIDDAHASQSQCYTTCTTAGYTTEHATTTSVKDEHPYYNNGYVCEYGIVCDTGYNEANNMTTAPYCVANAYRITLDSGNATTTGTNVIYTVYNTAIYLDALKTQQMGSSAYPIITPSRNGYIFDGYYTGTDGNGIKMINEQGYITNNFTPSYFHNDGTLYVKWASCNVPNAVSYDESIGGCVVKQCTVGYHPTQDGSSCVQDVIDCMDEISTSQTHIISATKKWDGTKYGICMVTECESGYHIESNTCVPNTSVFDIENGKCTRRWDEIFNRWDSDCSEISCNLGFAPNDSPYATDPTKPCSRCDNSYSAEGELAVVTWKPNQVCQIDKCLYDGQKYAKQGNICELVCIDRSDETGTMRWNDATNHCELTCIDGYVSSAQ